jgi:hypothetical protein
MTSSGGGRKRNPGQYAERPKSASLCFLFTGRLPGNDLVAHWAIMRYKLFILLAQLGGVEPPTS